MSSLEILRQRGKPYELRSTLAPGFLEVEDVEEIGRILRPEETWILQRFRPGLTLDPAWSGLPGTSKQEAEGLLDRARKIHPNTRLR
jgi:pyruvate-formate lyase-activating enzyme